MGLLKCRLSPHVHLALYYYEGRILTYAKHFPSVRPEPHRATSEDGHEKPFYYTHIPRGVS